MSRDDRSNVPFRRACAFLLAVVATAALLPAANAGLTRGGGGTTNDGQDDEEILYIAPSFEVQPEPMSGDDQLWLASPFFLPVPAIEPIPDGNFCFVPATVICEYIVRAGEPLLLDVTAAIWGGRSPSFDSLNHPQLSIKWTVSDGTISRTFQDDGLDSTESEYPLRLNLNGLRAGTYFVYAEFTFTLDDGWNFYSTRAPTLGDIRTGGFALLIGRTLVATGVTRLTIEPGAVAADGTPPTSSAAVSPAANALGWISANPTVQFTATDPASSYAGEPVSGLEFLAYLGTDGAGRPIGDSTTSSPYSVTFTADGAYSLAYSATDRAGNVEPPKSLTFRVDTVPPTVAATVSPAANAAGWNSAAATVQFACDDVGSGVQSCSPGVAVGEGAGQTVTGAATDFAGNSTTTNVTLNVDVTAPTIVAEASPAPNAAGWNDTAVTVSFTCTDALSGIASCSGPATLATDGANLSASGSARDVAGNSASASIGGVNVDRTAPTVAVTGVANGATYTLGSAPTADCSTTDALSGVQTAASLSTSGGSANGVGEFTATCSGATDVAGNAAAARTARYTIAYAFRGFFSPVDNAPVFNRTSAGQAVPIKFSLGGNYGLGILAAGSPSSRQVSCSTSAVADVESLASASSPTLTYDAAVDQYTYVWKTSKSFAGTCRQFELMLNDGSTRVAFFSFR